MVGHLALLEHVPGGTIGRCFAIPAFEILTNRILSMAVVMPADVVQPQLLAMVAIGALFDQRATLLNPRLCSR